MFRDFQMRVFRSPLLWWRCRPLSNRAIAIALVHGRTGRPILLLLRISRCLVCRRSRGRAFSNPCKRCINLLLCQVFRLKESDLFLNWCGGDAGVLENCMDARCFVSTYDKLLCSIVPRTGNLELKQNLLAQGLRRLSVKIPTAEEMSSSRAMPAVMYSSSGRII